MSQQSIELRIPGVPVAKPRVRATIVAGRVKMYTSQGHGVADFKALIRKVAAEHYTDAPLAVAVRVDCEFVFPRTKGQIWKRKPMPRLPKITKEDRDNLDKMILDSLTGVILRDDNVVWDGRITKWIAAGDEQPHTLVRITWTDAAAGKKR